MTNSQIIRDTYLPLWGAKVAVPTTDSHWVFLFDAADMLLLWEHLAAFTEHVTCKPKRAWKLDESSLMTHMSGELVYGVNEIDLLLEDTQLPFQSAVDRSPLVNITTENPLVGWHQYKARYAHLWDKVEIEYFDGTIPNGRFADIPPFVVLSTEVDGDTHYAKIDYFMFKAWADGQEEMPLTYWLLPYLRSDEVQFEMGWDRGVLEATINHHRISFAMGADDVYIANAKHVGNQLEGRPWLSYTEFKGHLPVSHDDGRMVNEWFEFLDGDELLLGEHEYHEIRQEQESELVKNAVDWAWERAEKLFAMLVPDNALDKFCRLVYKDGQESFNEKVTECICNNLANGTLDMEHEEGHAYFLGPFHHYINDTELFTDPDLPYGMELVKIFVDEYGDAAGLTIHTDGDAMTVEGE